MEFSDILNTFGAGPLRDVIYNCINIKKILNQCKI
jgi:hypothetical protein